MGDARRAAWAWTGAFFLARYMAVIDFMAPLYAALFLIQALLLAWTGLRRGAVAPGWHDGPVSWAGSALIAYAIIGLDVFIELGQAATKVTTFHEVGRIGGFRRLQALHCVLRRQIWTEALSLFVRLLFTALSPTIIVHDWFQATLGAQARLTD
jgi:hypothetical protein